MTAPAASGAAPPGGTRRLRVRVTGRVQGVGFRPFVWRAAAARGLTGWVRNDGGGVLVEAEGPAQALQDFLAALHSPPPLAAVTAVAVEDLAPRGGSGFAIAPSAAGPAAGALLAPDTPPCARCLAELDDPADRRFAHPFVVCTDCGPRFTVVQSLPYDRSRTTMRDFPLCPHCAAEYADPADRRYHAEPLCCPDCGPRLCLRDRDGRVLAGGPDRADGAVVAESVRLLREGAVLAVKGVGGYALCADATDEQAVARLRRRKRRPDRPLAVLVADLAAAERLCLLSDLERDLLAGAARPIVVARRRPGGPVAPAVAPAGDRLGVLLPPSALHLLLARGAGRPLVLTSGNRSGEPIVVDDAEALAVLAGADGPADAVLAHDRPIAARADDSVVQAAAGRVVPLRRARGEVPTPIALPVAAPQPVLGCGALLHSTVCLARGEAAVLSAHLGDLLTPAAVAGHAAAVEHLERLLGVAPQVLAHDLHPDHPATAYAQQRGLRRIGVQHHHAHVASCLADNGEVGPVIGVAFDGLGWGTDGTAWGGEVLLADLRTATRVGHLAPVPQPGGDAATREPWRMAVAHLLAAFGDAPPTGLAVQQRHADRWDAVRAVAGSPRHAPPTTSAGRLFDAVAALTGIRDTVTYDGQAAIELELAAGDPDPGTAGYPVPLRPGTPFTLDPAPLIRAVVADLAAGVPVARISGRFHAGLADAVAAACRRVRAAGGPETVALSGGVFGNRLLLAGCLDRLHRAGLRVLTHRRVPCGDGGLSLGQAAVAAAVLAAEG